MSVDVLRPAPELAPLYEEDETAWLDAMAAIAREGRADELDLAHLAEFLQDMAERERREVESRLVVLLMHLLKWNYQPERRSRSWRSTVVEQRQELKRIAGQGALRRHGAESLVECYRDAIERAAVETGLDRAVFPVECPYAFDALLTIELPDEG